MFKMWLLILLVDAISGSAEPRVLGHVERHRREVTVSKYIVAYENHPGLLYRLYNCFFGVFSLP